MGNTKKLGADGENIAVLFLESKEYEIVEKNYRAKLKIKKGAGCEIDIIAKKDGYIVFAEVKTRSSLTYGVPSESVNINKQRHIISAAKYFLMGRGSLYSESQPRFDVIEIYRDNKTGKNYVCHIEGAFITNEKNSY
ncbi:MAG: YraN family protein [Oscillospiraceae bacterium]|nr:YraN family protein [Oscillospiraceae bacterium]